MRLRPFPAWYVATGPTVRAFAARTPGVGGRPTCSTRQEVSSESGHGDVPAGCQSSTRRIPHLTPRPPARIVTVA